MARIKKGDRVSAKLRLGICTGYVIAKKPVDGVMRYEIRLSDDYMLAGLYASQLTKLPSESDDE